MKRYMVFGFGDYYPEGGMNDYLTSFDTEDQVSQYLEAVVEAAKENYSGFTVLDTLTSVVDNFYVFKEYKKKPVLKKTGTHTIEE